MPYVPPGQVVIAPPPEMPSGPFSDPSLSLVTMTEAQARSMFGELERLRLQNAELEQRVVDAGGVETRMEMAVSERWNAFTNPASGHCSLIASLYTSGASLPDRRDALVTKGTR